MAKCSSTPKISSAINVRPTILLPHTLSQSQPTGLNTGYKHSDATHPCKICWSKYSKPFSGPLAYAFSQFKTTFQRPLHWPMPQAPASTTPPPPPPQPQQPRISLPGGYGYTSAPTTSPYRLPNAVVYKAGDPRLGGRPSWNCDGNGSVSFLFSRSAVCEVCSGIGRVWR
ncbi:hypothetical protein H2248_011129 [Termitomyces sp. 'cryptogamus']|nr:hypothetical protein H2248_011129 [Termitomyces sp. 'cryptogamus']